MKYASILVLFVLSACAHSNNLPERSNDPRQVHVDLYEQGKALAVQGDYVRAEQYFAGALQTGADVDVVLPVLLRVCIATERYEAALAYAERYEPTARDSVELELVLAALQLAVGQVDAARRSLELVLAQKEDFRAHYMLGDLYYNTLQDYGSADTHYRRYLALAPNDKHATHVKRLLLKRPSPRALREVSKEAPETVELPGEAAIDDSAEVVQ